MNNFVFSKKIARLIILQRIELLSLFQKKLRKLFGRYAFVNFFLYFLINKKKIQEKYFSLMQKEYKLLKNEIQYSNKKFLSIGGGVGGFELIVNKSTNNNFFYFIEKNYVSKKIIYGWDNKNLEAYNDLLLVKNFLLENGMKSDQFKIFDYDKQQLPEEKFDIIISLYSLDYHYDFNIYRDYLKKASHNHTKIIFDTIRSEHFKKIFKNVKIIQSHDLTVHKSKRIVCNEFI